MAVTTKNAVFWDVAPCSLQPPVHAGSSLADFSTMKIEAKRFSETSVYTRSTGATTQKTAFFSLFVAA
jgi:hypothetical protein